MLKRLTKYDLKWINKGLVVFYVLAFLFSILTRVFMIFDDSTIMNIVSSICSAVTIGILINIVINNLLRVWGRFVKNMYGDESYLTHTLPVDRKTIYLAKFLSAILSLLQSMIVILLCIIIAFLTKENWESLKVMLNGMATVYNSKIISMLFFIFITFFLEILFALVCGYLGIIIGHQANNNRMIKSVLLGLLLYFVSQGVLLGFIFITGFLNNHIMSLFTTNNLVNIEALKTIMYIAIVIYSIYILVNYFVSTKLLSKGINID